MTSKIFLSFLFCVAVWLVGLAWFVWQIPSEPLAEVPRTDAIVVLTGGAGRLEYGMQLLAEGKSDHLFVSGVLDGVTKEKLLLQVPPDIRGRLTPEKIQNIGLGYKAVNTIGNAAETARWLKKHDYHTILLVTGNYHMPRSTEEFEEAAPDVVIIPAPVFPEYFILGGWWQNDESRELVLLEYHKFLAAKLRHLIIPSPVSGGGLGRGVTSDISPVTPSTTLPPAGGGRNK